MPSTASRRTRTAKRRAPQQSGLSQPTVIGLPNPLPRIEAILKRDEADIIVVAGNVALLVFGVVEWPIVAMTGVLHLMARSRFKSLEAIADIGEEVE